MVQLFENLYQVVFIYFETTPGYTIAAHALFAVGWIPIAGVIVWGLLQLWMDARQGNYAGTFKWQLLRVSVPQDAIQTPKGMENFFTNLAGAKSSITLKEKWFAGKFQPWFSLEIVSMGGELSFYIRTVSKYRDIVEAAMYAQYPEAQISEVEDYVNTLPSDYPNDDWDIWGSEMQLKKPGFMPIRTWIDFEHQGEKDARFKDPLLSLLEGFGKMQPGEMLWLQILIMPPEDQGWTKAGEKFVNATYGNKEKPKKGMFEDTLGWIPGEMIRQVTGGEFAVGGEDGKADDFAAFKITAMQRDQLDAIARKISKIGWYTKIRFVYGAKNELYRKGTIASMIKGIFHQYGHLGWNNFGIHGDSTPKDDYVWQEWQMPRKKKNLISRYKSRSPGAGATGFIMNVEELATLFHFPAADARTPVLTSLGSRRSEAPIELQLAAENMPDLPNLDRKSPDFGASTSVGVTPRLVARPLARPTLTPPTGGVGVDRSRVAGTDKTDKANGAAEEERRQAAPLPPEENMPRPGMPAPLPPGLDLSDEPINGESPHNLPVD